MWLKHCIHTQYDWFWFVIQSRAGWTVARSSLRVYVPLFESVLQLKSADARARRNVCADEIHSRDHEGVCANHHTRAIFVHLSYSSYGLSSSFSFAHSKLFPKRCFSHSTIAAAALFTCVRGGTWRVLELDCARQENEEGGALCVMVVVSDEGAAADVVAVACMRRDDDVRGVFFYILFIPLHIYAIALRWISEWWYTRHSGRQRQNSPKETTIRVYILFTRWVLATLHMDNLGVAYSFIYQCISQIVLSSNFFFQLYSERKKVARKSCFMLESKVQQWFVSLLFWKRPSVGNLFFYC